MFRLAVIFCLFAACYAGIVLPRPRSMLPIAGRIVGGVETTIEDIPHQVALLYRSYILCGGSIIREDVIVSACHCIFSLSPSEYTIRAGSSHHSSGGQVVNVKQIFYHEKYDDDTVDFDISLFILTAPLELGSGVKPIALPKQDQDVADGSMSVTSGWGTTSQGGSVSAVLRKVSIPIVNQKICKDAYETIDSPITDQMICAGEFEDGGKDACQGDSGGPLTVEDELVGITSWGYGCARPGFPGVWARVPAFISWIEEKLV